MRLREIRENETELLKIFLYEAIFIPEGVNPPDRSIIDQPELKIYYEDFGTGRADHCIIADDDGKAVGSVWTRIMNEMLALLKEKGYKHASLAVQKANYAVRMYEQTGFKTVNETEEEFIMVCDLL